MLPLAHDQPLLEWSTNQQADLWIGSVEAGGAVNMRDVVAFYADGDCVGFVFSVSGGAKPDGLEQGTGDFGLRMPLADVFKALREAGE